MSNGNKCDPDQPCLSQITRALPRNLSNGAGDKPRYEDGTEPAAFIKRSGTGDEAGYYLPTACKVTVQSATGGGRRRA